MDRIAVTAESASPRGYIVGQYPVAALALKLAAGVADDVVRLRRKADDENGPVVAALCDAGEDIGVLGQVQQRRAATVFFEFMRGGALRPPIGDGGRHDGDVDRQRGLARREHLR